MAETSAISGVKEGMDRAAEKLRIDGELVASLLSRFLHNEITKAGFSRAVLGLSGGLDSALAAYLAARALGPENVLVLRMPYETSSPSSLEDAQRVIDDLGVPSETIDITPIVQPAFAASPGITPTRMGNVMARTRMILLYDRSAAWDALVVGTSNKTETLLGYSTVHGDSACALAPIADLYKTQVRQLARRLGVPAAIIDKAPSADLWPGQTDEADLGLSYDEADAILLLLLEERQSPAEVIARGFAEAKVQRVCDLCRRSYFKRRLPPVAAVSTCCVGRDIAPGTVPPHMDDQ